MSTVLNGAPPETIPSFDEQETKPQFPGIPTTSDGAGMVVWVETHITQGACATRVAARTGRHPQTVMDWVHAYNERGPDALVFRRTGGRPPFARRSQQRFVMRSAPPSAGQPLRPSKGLIQRHAGPCAVWSAGSASASA